MIVRLTLYALLVIGLYSYCYENTFYWEAKQLINPDPVIAVQNEVDEGGTSDYPEVGMTENTSFKSYIAPSILEDTLY